MTVYVNDSCLKDQLKNMGYTITDDINSDFDAYIYSGSMQDLFQSECNNTVFIVNSEGKSGAEIDNILQKRLYSPIFSL